MNLVNDSLLNNNYINATPTRYTIYFRLGIMTKNIGTAVAGVGSGLLMKLAAAGAKRASGPISIRRIFIIVYCVLGVSRLRASGITVTLDISKMKIQSCIRRCCSMSRHFSVDAHNKTSTIVFLRHGQSIWNQQNIFIGILSKVINYVHI